MSIVSKNANYDDAITRLREEKLPEIESAAHRWLEEINNAFSATSDSHAIQAAHQHLIQLIESTQSLVAAQGLSSIPLLSQDFDSRDQTSLNAKNGSKNLIQSNSNFANPPHQTGSKQATSSERTTNSQPQSEQEALKSLSDLATQSFERRARLKEAAGIVTGILKPGGS